MSWSWIIQGFLLFWSAMVLVALPSLPADSKAVDQHQKTTTKPYFFRIIVRQQPRRFQNIYRRQCCQVGKQAARKGYSCYIKTDIARIRINMPMRYKMKTDVHGEKYDYDFARKMEFCSKTSKLTRKFNHCCDKVARNMDRQRFLS